MSVALMIIAALLIVLIVGIGVRGVLKDRAARKQEEADAGVRSGKVEAQHEESRRRQAGVRAAHAERASKQGSDTDE